MNTATGTGPEGHTAHFEVLEVEIPSDGMVQRYERLMPPRWVLTWPSGFELEVRGLDPLRLFLTGCP